VRRLRREANQQERRHNSCFRDRHALAAACHRRRFDLSMRVCRGYRSERTGLKLARWALASATR
jgi:hypothetical protein